MTLRDFWRFFSRKQSQSQTVLAVQQIGRPIATPKNYDSFAKESYQKNVIAYRAVASIARNAGSIPWNLYKKRAGGKPVEINEHLLLKLLERPNPMQGRAALFERLVSFYMISGNTFIEACGPSKSGPPAELWIPRPDRMKVIAGPMGLPSAYVYQVGASKTTYDCDIVNGKSPIRHIKTFHPTDDWYGMSPIEAASLSVDQHNEAGLHNLALLQNSAQPSGALRVVASDRNPTGRLEVEQFERLKADLEEKYSGSANAGKPMILTGGMEWTPMGFSPKDMDWIDGKHTSARDVAMALGYPPLLLGIPGDSTYNNQKEARLALFTETILPIMDSVKDELNHWLTPAFGDGIYLDYDKDEIDALQILRSEKWTQVSTSDFLTPNEKREAVGYEPIDGGDTLLVQSSLVPIDFADEPPAEEEEVDPVDDDEFEQEDPEDDDPKKSIERKAKENNFSDFVKEWIDRHLGEKITNIEETTKKKVRAAIKEAYDEHLEEGSNLDEFSDSIRSKVADVYDDMGDTRSRTIARTETSMAAGEGTLAAAKALEIPGMQKEWVSADDDRVRGSDPKDTTNHMDMNGVRIDLNEKFAVPSGRGTDAMEGPGDVEAPADQLVNCRCTLLFYTDDEKSLNIHGTQAKRRHARAYWKKRHALERAFANQVKAVFKKEAVAVNKALKGITDKQLAELSANHALDDMRKSWETVMRANLTTILNEFGKQILKAVP